MSSGSNATRATISFVGVDLDDASSIVGTPRALVAARRRSTTRGRGARPRVAMTVDVRCVTPTSAIARMSCDLGISTVPDPGVHDLTAIVHANVVGQYLRHGVPVAGREVGQEALRPLGLPRFPAAAPAGAVPRSARARRRGLLRRNFAAAEQVAVDHQNDDLAHSASKPSCEVAMRRLGDDRSEVAQSMHGSRRRPGFRRDVPNRHGCSRSTHLARTCSSGDGRHRPSPASSRGVRAG